MKNTSEKIQTAHQNDLQWQKDIAFYADEIILLRQKLGEVSSKNTSKEIKMMVSHFENQFIINKELIDELRHDIHMRENNLTELMKINPVAYEHRIVTQDAELRGKMLVFEKMFTELRKSFNKFLSETL